MVATSDCAVKSKPVAGSKVSKPLMEKKRRARINKSLEQLKSLLESYYTSNIRKRKLEKADILELTVKHLRNQKIYSGATAASDVSDYQAGFRSCLASVNHLLMADTLSGRDRWVLAQLSSKLCCSRGRSDVSSTSDSDAGPQAETAMQRLLPPTAGPEARTPPRQRALTPARTAPPSPPTPSPVSKRAATQNTPENTSSGLCLRNKFHSVGQSRNDGTISALHNVWRPW